ncbi:MAG: DUF1552 domain-containing protein [Planctomycetota bacterium]
MEHGTETAIEALAGSGPRLTAAPLPRRAVLRGAGVAIALPWLEAMASAGTRVGGRPRPPRRLVVVYAPNGVRVDAWRLPIPKADAEDPVRDVTPPMFGAWPLTDLPRVLQPLAPHRDSLQILRGLAQDKARANGDGPGDHARAAAAFLTGVQPLKTEGRVRLGVSADQVAARTVGGATRVRSLVLGLEVGRQSGQCDSGYACAYSGHVSWESATTPAAKEVVPRRAFDRLFRGGDAGESVAGRRARADRRRSILDFARDESKRLESRLGAEDRARLDEYRTGLRELERQLSFPSAAHVDDVGDADRPEGTPATFREHAALFSRVVALALRTDLTRVVTLMLGNEGSSRRYTEVGVREGHHSLSHHGGDATKLDQIEAINRLHVESFAGLVDELAAAEEGEGRVLDSSMLVYGSGIAEGNRHDHHDLPLALVGGGLTDLSGGRTVVFRRDTPMNDLHLALLERMGVRGVSLGDGRGPLADL